MNKFVKQGAQFTFPLGPFVSDSDGKTPVTDLTIAQADIQLSKIGGAYAQTHNAAGATHMAGGRYSVTYDSTDTNTVGMLRVDCQMTGAIPVWDTFFVLPAPVYDALVGTAPFPSNITQVAGGSVSSIHDFHDEMLGAGAIAHEYIVTDSGTEQPIDGVEVWVSTDSSGANVVAAGYTDTLGSITFYLDAGTYYFWCKKSGYSFANPDMEVVS